MNFERELELARAAARKAGDLALEIQTSLACGASGGIQAEAKSDDSPVTVADRESERLIAGLIDEHFPEDGILGEEGSNKASSNGRRWIIDPIDGTRDFVRGNMLWAVLIGFEQDGEVKAGVAHMPVLGRSYYAVRGMGAYCDGTRLQASAIDSFDRAVLSPNSLNKIGKAPFGPGLMAWMEQFWAIRCLGGCLDSLMVASGQMEVWIEPVVAPWDLAPSQVILEEAGAVFFDFRGRRTIYGGSAVGCVQGLEAQVRAFITGSSAQQ